MSANTGKSRGQSPALTLTPAAPPPQRPESLLTPTGDTLLSPRKPRVRDFEKNMADGAPHATPTPTRMTAKE